MKLTHDRHTPKNTFLEMCSWKKSKEQNKSSCTSKRKKGKYVYKSIAILNSYYRLFGKMGSFTPNRWYFFDQTDWSPIALMTKALLRDSCHHDAPLMSAFFSKGGWPRFGGMGTIRFSWEIGPRCQFDFDNWLVEDPECTGQHCQACLQKPDATCLIK